MAVDEERRRAGGAAVVSAVDVALDTQGVATVVQVGGEAVDVEPEIAGVGRQVSLLERVLVFEQRVVELPESSLGAGGFSGFRCGSGVLVDVF